jgi:hypothetical protein
MAYPRRVPNDEPTSLPPPSGPRTSYHILVYQRSDGRWMAELPAVPGYAGLIFQGDTALDAIAKIVEVCFMPSQDTTPAAPSRR